MSGVVLSESWGLAISTESDLRVVVHDTCHTCPKVLPFFDSLYKDQYDLIN
jgi:hypothetical protein